MGYLESNITKYLYHKNCPNIVFRKIWQYAPHTNVIEIKDLKENLYKEILLLGCKRKVYKCLHLLYTEFRSYTEIIKVLSKMYNCSKYRKEMLFSKNSKIKLGKYVYFRANMQKMGILK